MNYLTVSYMSYFSYYSNIYSYGCEISNIDKENNKKLLKLIDVLNSEFVKVIKLYKFLLIKRIGFISIGIILILRLLLFCNHYNLSSVFSFDCFVI